MPMTMMMRVYYSTYHLWAAGHFLELTSSIEDNHQGRSRFDIKHRAYVTNTIFSSVAFLEAAINELYQDCHDDHDSYIGNLNKNAAAILKEYWEMTEGKDKGLSVLDKYQLALRFCGKEPFRKGDSPYQEVYLLVRIRNALTHYKPQTLGGEAIHDLERKLHGRFQENKLMEESGNPYFPDKALGKGCASWAVSSTIKFADSFFQLLEVKPNYQRVNFE